MTTAVGRDLGAEDLGALAARRLVRGVCRGASGGAAPMRGCGVRRGGNILQFKNSNGGFKRKT